MAKEDRRTITDEIAVENIRAYNSEKGPYAYFDLVILPALTEGEEDMAVIKSCRIVEGRKRLFIAGPSHKSGDTYYSDAYINLTKDEIDPIKVIIEEAIAAISKNTPVAHSDEQEKKMNGESRTRRRNRG